MIAWFIAIQVATNSLAQGAESTMTPISAPNGVSLFKEICFDQFPNSQASIEQISRPEYALVKEPETPSQAMQPGDAWFSSTARVTYVDADWMPRDLPSPECSVTVRLKDAPKHGELASLFSSQLNLPQGRIGKDSSRAQSQWDMSGVSPDKWRLFLTTQETPSGTELTMMIMNLRGKKK
ncbi:MAG: hypothetical protein ABI395_05820 [Sphingobium sp.]